MFENLSVRIPYPTPQEGFWGQPTSTLNWCEEDYILSHYTAEITNTLTNVLFIALGIRGVRNCLKYKHDTVFVIAYLGYLLVGCGSFAFHATLSYPMQLVDELSMIYTTSILCYAIFAHERSRLFSIFLGIGLVALSISITAYYHYIQDPTFHQNAFSILFLATVFRSLYTMEAILRPMLSKTYTNKPSRASVLSKETRRSVVQGDRAIIYEMRWIVTMGFITCAAGIAAWKVDNIRCSDLVRWRHEVGLPWGILLEGHGWWYVIAPRYCAVL
ncbi:YPC1-alkaline ceramidase [Fusarium fujikuroi]|nr:YPC1-alkaline ceramidase [Fusarium fujikuroi]